MTLLNTSYWHQARRLTCLTLILLVSACVFKPSSPNGLATPADIAKAKLIAGLAEQAQINKPIVKSHIGFHVRSGFHGLTQYDIDFLTVNGDPQVVKAAIEGKGVKNTKILAVTFLTSLDRQDLTNNLIKDGKLEDLVIERATRAFEAGADGVIALSLIHI